MLVSGGAFTCPGSFGLHKCRAAFTQSQFMGHLVKRQTAESMSMAVSSDGFEKLRSQEKWADTFL